MKTGDNIICHKECIMNTFHNKTTTIGKIYKVIYVDVQFDELVIIDDENEEHYFGLNDEYFYSLKDLRKNKIKQLNEL